jgi:hypothetical protein
MSKSFFTGVDRLHLKSETFILYPFPFILLDLSRFALRASAMRFLFLLRFLLRRRSYCLSHAKTA